MAAGVDPSAWAAFIGVGVSIIGGALIMAWRLGALSTKVENLGGQLDDNTHRLDAIDAKADQARELASAATATAQAATATAQSTAQTVSTVLRFGGRRQREDDVT